MNHPIVPILRISDHIECSPRCMLLVGTNLRISTAQRDALQSTSAGADCNVRSPVASKANTDEPSDSIVDRIEIASSRADALPWMYLSASHGVGKLTRSPNHSLQRVLHVRAVAHTQHGRLTSSTKRQWLHTMFCERELVSVTSTRAT